MKTIYDYSILCTPEQTKKALALGASIEIQDFVPLKKGQELVKGWFANGNKCYHIPTAEQMIGFLEEQGMLLSINYSLDGNCSITYTTGLELICRTEYSSRKEATLAAIDAALDYLSNKNNYE